jgi:predicted nucleotidyltransferase
LRIPDARGELHRKVQQIGLKFGLVLKAHYNTLSSYEQTTGRDHPMRLKSHEKQAIIMSVLANIATPVAIWLFGSRVDDNKRGGDIDLFVEYESQQTPAISWKNKRKIINDITNVIGEQKIDLITHEITEPSQPIHNIARATGIKLS